MAIAFARIAYHSRSQGHSAVAGAAYRAGVELKDGRTGEIHNFKNRSDVIYSEVLLPEGAATHFKDRETLWNAVEAAETRKNSQIAKDIVLALPKDLDLALQIDLARNFANTHFVRHGIVSDIAIHSHSDGNPHAHIYVSTRRLLGDRFDKVKARDLEPDVVRGRVVDPQFWGEKWRDFQNDYFIEQGIDLVVDANHIFSQRHEGRVRSQSHYLKEENQLKREASIEVTVHDPSSLLNILGTQYAVFSDRDIFRLIHKNTETLEQYETALLGLKSHPDLILLGPGDDGRDRFTTRANYQREVELAEHADLLNSREQHPVNGDLLERASLDFGLNVEQADALIYIVNGSDISAIVGRAGTGKSYMMRAAKQCWEASGYRVLGMAVSGIAAKGLEASSNISSSTIYSIKMQLAFGKLEIGANDILVMDEAGMTDLHDFALIVDTVRTSGAKLVIIGDSAQLQPIGIGASFRAITERIGFTELNHIQRQTSLGDCAASQLLARGLVGQALDHYDSQQQIHLVNSNEEDEEGEGGGGTVTQLRLIGDWSQELTAENVQERLILAHRNSDVKELNQAAREKIQALGLLGKDTQKVATTNHGAIELSSGDKILFLRNDRSLGVSNGEFATVSKIMGDQITVKLGNTPKREMTFSTNDYQNFNYGYAATVHKSQGATYDQVFVYIGSPTWDRFLSYVAMTRHRKSLNVYADRTQFKNLTELKASLSRSTLRDSVLDWPLSFAIRRGFDPEKLMGWFIDKVLGIKQAIHDVWLFVANYAAFKVKKAYRQSVQDKIKQRALAKKVALLVDLRNQLGTQARRMRRELNPHEQLYDHPGYRDWYEQILKRNQLAYGIKQDYEQFKDALNLNRVSNRALEKMVMQHERSMLVNDYLTQNKEKESTAHHEMAKNINNDLNEYFSSIKYFAEKQDLSAKIVIDRIKEDSKFTDNSRTISDEWMRLKTIDSHAVERILIAKTRLDRATEPLSKEIQTRGFENAVKALCRQKSVFEKVKAIAPELSKTFEKINAPIKEVTINWVSEELNADFDTLKKSKDSHLQYLVKFRDYLKNNPNQQQGKIIAKRLDSLAMDIGKFKSKMEELKKLAPNLSAKLEAFVKFRFRQNEMGRDLD
ncbi:MAG: Conjugal transfer protein TraA [Pseudomonadota bacterium]|jgi:Ti-type conjugative transfer relaxase TraA